MIKRYLNTFKGSTTAQRGRRFGFAIFTFFFALLFSLYFAVAKTFDNPLQAIGIEFLIGLVITIIVDNVAGIGRKSPLIKD